MRTFGKPATTKKFTIRALSSYEKSLGAKRTDFRAGYLSSDVHDWNIVLLYKLYYEW